MSLKNIGGMSKYKNKKRLIFIELISIIIHRVLHII